MTVSPVRTFSRRALFLGAAEAAAVAGCASLSGRAKAPSGPDVEDLIRQMTLAEKVGQMTQADYHALRKRPQDITELALGSILSGGNSIPSPNNIKSWADIYDDYQRRALASRLHIPMIYGIDAVHGYGTCPGATVFPHNIGLGCTRNPGLVEKVSRVTAIEVSASGIDWTFAPCLAVARDERWGRTYEGFGESPELAESMGAAAVRGFQGASLSEPTSILACAKHFIGDGGTVGGKDQGETDLADPELRRLHLAGYLSTIKAGVATVMVSYNSVRGEPMHGHQPLINGLLKGELGFQGIVVSDWDGIDKVKGDYPAKVVKSVNAGIDLFMVPNRYAEFITLLRAAVEKGEVPMTRIDDAVRRILRQKVACGLWARPFADRSLMPLVGSAEHRAVARQAVRESMVVLKNEGGALPIARSIKRIHVAGSRADDIGAQCGGWTGDWQGKRGPITEGTTILAGLRKGAPGVEVSYTPDGSGADGADVCVAVLGEDPYAEGKGDRQDLSLSADDTAVLGRLKAIGRPVIVVLVSGRPMVLGPALEQADALVAAWLPGTEGAGVADVLLGAHKAGGKLSHSWPRAMSQLPLNVGDSTYDPLFPYGFGLTT